MSFLLFSFLHEIDDLLVESAVTESLLLLPELFAHAFGILGLLDLTGAVAVILLQCFLQTIADAIVRIDSDFGLFHVGILGNLRVEHDASPRFSKFVLRTDYPMQA